jgi:hypothetical protein
MLLTPQALSKVTRWTTCRRGDSGLATSCWPSWRASDYAASGREELARFAESRVTLRTPVSIIRRTALWHDTEAKTGYDDQADRDKLSRLIDDTPPFDDDRRAELDKLDAWEIPWLLIPAEELPGPGNLRTECDQLVMLLRGDTYDTVELRWICYLKHTGVELRTFDISSEDIDRWLAELEQGDQHAEEVPHSRS